MKTNLTLRELKMTKPVFNWSQANGTAQFLIGGEPHVIAGISKDQAIAINEAIMMTYFEAYADGKYNVTGVIKECIYLLENDYE